MKMSSSGMILFITGVLFSLYAATYTVSKDGRGEYTSVQNAVNAAKSGDEVVILDFAVYEEQVTIDSSKNRLTLKSENPELNMKPTISFQDDINVGPRNYEESQDQSKINFDMNGGVRVMRAQGVTIEGIILDGGGPAPFGYEGVWENRYPLFHGNAALTLYVTGDVVVRNCEIQNGYYGVYIKDRNEGGIYANANPADLQPQLVVPLSGFGKTGNHLFEQNRIHNNSWGLYFESAWDLGSNVRYNLFYDNHHTTELETTVKDLPDGGNQHGGAVLFKDLLLSQVAIYNNTFYHNNLIFCADWQVGGPHLFFNNIYGPPYGGKVTGSHQALDVAMPNRMFHCLYSIQEGLPELRTQTYNDGAQDPETNEYVEGRTTVEGYGYVRILNGFPDMRPTPYMIDIEIPLSSGTIVRQREVEWEILPGTIISSATVDNPFPANAGNRWFEIEFKSTDPDDPDFLSPDWDDSLVQLYVVDQGWPAAGIRDADGTMADIGAIPMGGIPETEILVKPKDPVFITDGTKAKVKFDVSPMVGTINNPKIKYVRWISNVTYTPDIWGTSQTEVISATDIVEVTVPSTPIVVGTNTLTFTIPAMTNNYGFFDIIVEGTDGNGKEITTNVGFLPYREIDYIFDVVIMSADGTQKLTTVQAGQTVQLWITPKRLDGQPFDVKVDQVSVTLSSNYDLLTPTGEVFSLPNGVQGTSKSNVVFTRVPESGFDGVEVSGMFTNPNDADVFFAIRGSSDDIIIIPGPPEKIEFQRPPSNGVLVVDPGTTQPVTVQAFDKYGNKINTSTSISLVSTAKEVGDVVESPVASNETGLATFRVLVTKGDLNDTFPVVATLDVNGATDNAKIVVGEPRDKYWIFYDDVGAYNPSAEIDACSGTRVPVTIWVSKEGVEPIATQTSQFAIDLGSGLAAYASAEPTDTVRITQSSLEGGMRVIWITSTAKNVANGMISVYATDGMINNTLRENINFKPCNTSIQSAVYYALKGRGSVDRVEIKFEKDLLPTEIPDSIVFFWPNSAGEQRIVYKSDMTIDPEDSSHLSIVLTTPFAEGVTRYIGSSVGLGVFYWNNPLTPDAPTNIVPFSIADGVGPLITSALLIERLSDGNDTLLLTFTETVDYTNVQGESLTLIKNGEKIQLTVIECRPNEEGYLVAVVENLGVQSPTEGDSLMITFDGPIVDEFNNHAHHQNRPVALALRQIPADITIAWYEDKNADGVIDHVHIEFNKAVNLAQIEVSVVWNSSIKADRIASERITFSGGGNTAIDVAIDGLLDRTAMIDKTSGNMQVHVLFTAFTSGNLKSTIAADRAAPVLTTVTYKISQIVYNGQARDTVVFSLSENSIVQDAERTPLLFVNDEGVYSVTLDFLKKNGLGEYVYLVDPVGSESPVPLKNDSVWINTSPASISDELQNTQANSTNKRVALVLVFPPLIPELKWGPNPFNPKIGSENGIFHVTIKPKKNIEYEGVAIEIKAMLRIYDKVGNLVKHFDWKTENNKLEIKWDGTNNNGRFVGNGTYLGLFYFSLIHNGVEEVQPIEKIYIGIKQ